MDPFGAAIARVLSLQNSSALKTRANFCLVLPTRRLLEVCIAVLECWSGVIVCKQVSIHFLCFWKDKKKDNISANLRRERERERETTLLRSSFQGQTGVDAPDHSDVEHTLARKWTDARVCNGVY